MHRAPSNSAKKCSSEVLIKFLFVIPAQAGLRRRDAEAAIRVANGAKGVQQEQHVIEALQSLAVALDPGLRRDDGWFDGPKAIRTFLAQPHGVPWRANHEQSAMQQRHLESGNVSAHCRSIFPGAEDLEMSNSEKSGSGSSSPSGSSSSERGGSHERAVKGGEQGQKKSSASGSDSSEGKGTGEKHNEKPGSGSGSKSGFGGSKTGK